MKNRKKKNTIILLIITLVLIGLIVGGIVAYKKLHKSKPPAATELSNSQAPSTNEQTNQSNDQPATAANSNKATSSATPAAPKPPTFTKSSGNTGPIPSGVTVDFTCMSEVNTECSIILNSGAKQIVLGPSKIADNSRGTYAVDFYWTSVKGSYTVTAQAKNSQGGISTSAAQTLVVQ
jgi:hypothetical protein